MEPYLQTVDLAKHIHGQISLTSSRAASCARARHNHEASAPLALARAAAARSLQKETHISFLRRRRFRQRNAELETLAEELGYRTKDAKEIQKEFCDLVAIMAGA